MALLYVPPADFTNLPGEVYQIEGPQVEDASFEAPFIVGVSDHRFNEELRSWMSFAGMFAVSNEAHIPETASDALRVTLERTGWSFRAVEDVLGVKHTQVRRILNKEQEARDDVARRIYDLEVLTREVSKTTRGDRQRIRLAFETVPAGRSENAFAVIKREHNLPRAMMFASEALFPASEPIVFHPASMYIDDAVVDIAGA